MSCSYFEIERPSRVDGVKVGVNGGGPIRSLEFAVDPSPVDPITLGAGANVEFTDRDLLVNEVQGYEGTLYGLISLGLRF